MTEGQQTPVETVILGGETSYNQKLEMLERPKRQLASQTFLAFLAFQAF